MTAPEISIATAVVLMVLQMGLMLSVGLHRASTRIGVGHGQDEDLHRKVRRHANLAENAALFLVALGFAEISGVPSSFLFPVAAIFVTARLSHAIAFTSHAGSHTSGGSFIYPALRGFGAFGTVGGCLAIAVLLATHVLGGS